MQVAANDTGTATDAAGGDPADEQVAQTSDDAPYRPGGLIVTQGEGIDPLDPQGVNEFPTAEEQKRIADTVNAIQQGKTDKLDPHAYRNIPDPKSQAMLPTSSSGYTVYDLVETKKGNRGVKRLIVDNTTGDVYYTNTHYRSFYKIIFNEK